MKRNSIAIAGRRDIDAARYSFDNDEVIVDARRIKRHGLLPLALKYALYSVKPGGHIIIEDDADGELDSPAYTVPHKLVRSWTFKFIGADVDVLSTSPGRLELVRTRPVIAPGWSAGVVFSGRDSEIPVLRQCLDGLMAQPELAPEQSGEIVVCGPPRDLGFLADYPHVRYLEHEMPPGERVMISEKKNFLIRHMKGPRVAVLHARVVLSPGALAAVPREFDITGPNVQHEINGRSASYLSLINTDTAWPGLMPRHTSRLMRHAGDDPLKLHGHGMLFVDGGAFFVTKAAHEACPLHDLIAWNEAEDVEWCARAFHQGLLVDIAPRSMAVSLSSKIRIPPAAGPLTTPALNLIGQVRTARAWLRYRLGSGRKLS